MTDGDERTVGWGAWGRGLLTFGFILFISLKSKKRNKKPTRLKPVRMKLKLIQIVKRRKKEKFMQSDEDKNRMKQE